MLGYLYNISCSVRSSPKYLELLVFRSLGNKKKTYFKLNLRVCLFSGNWLSKHFCICLSLRKLVNEKYFPVKEKLGLIFKKVFSFYWGRKTLSRSCEKIRNIILFANYVKFSSQTFDCYIFCLNFFFHFHPLKFDLIWFLY